MTSEMSGLKIPKENWKESKNFQNKKGFIDFFKEYWILLGQ